MNIVTKPYFWPVFFLLAFVAVLCKFYPVYQAVALIPAMTAGIILIDNPRRYLFWYLFLLGVFPVLQRILPMGLGVHLDELIGGAIIFLFMMGLVFRKLGVRTSYQTLFQLLMGWSIVSMAFNQSPIVNFLRYLLSFGLFIPIYILAKTYMKMDDLTSFVKGAIVIFWINFVLNLGWYLGINPIHNEMIAIGSYVDMAMGTFNGCNYVAYFCSMLAYFLICIIHFRVGNKYFRRAAKATLIAIFVQLYFTYTNHAIVLFVVAGVPVLFLSGILKRWGLLLLVVGMGFGVGVLMRSDTQLSEQLNSENLRMRKELLHQSAKVIIYEDLTVKALHDNPQEWIMGGGPGYGIGPIAKDSLSPMALRYLLKFYAAFGADQRKMQMTSITGSTSSAILSVWSDVGAVGSALYFLPFFMMMVQSFIMATRVRSPERKAFYIGLFSSVIYLFIICVLIDILHMKFFSYSLWAIFGILAGNAAGSKKQGGEESCIEEVAKG